MACFNTSVLRMVLAAQLLFGVAGAAEEWRAEIKSRLEQQRRGITNLDAECLRIRVPSTMLSVTSRDALNEHFDRLGEECDEAHFLSFSRDILRDSEKYEQPFSEVRVVLSSDGSAYEERIVPRANGEAVRERQATQSGVMVTTRRVAARTQAIVSDGKSKFRTRVPSVDDVLFRPTFDVSLYQVCEAEDHAFKLCLDAGREEYRVSFDRLTGLVNRYSISEVDSTHTSPVLDVWQISSIKVSRNIYLPKVLAQADYDNGQISKLHVTFVRKAETPEAIDESDFASAVPAGTIVADVRGADPEKNVERFVASTELSDVRKSVENKSLQHHPAPNDRTPIRAILIGVNVMATLAIAYFVVRQKRSTNSKNSRTGTPE